MIVLIHFIKSVLLHNFFFAITDVLKQDDYEKSGLVPVGIEPTTLALLAPRSNQTEL